MTSHLQKPAVRDRQTAASLLNETYLSGFGALSGLFSIDDLLAVRADFVWWLIGPHEYADVNLDFMDDPKVAYAAERRSALELGGFLEGENGKYDSAHRRHTRVLCEALSWRLYGMWAMTGAEAFLSTPQQRANDTDMIYTQDPGGCFREIADRLPREGEGLHPGHGLRHVTPSLRWKRWLDATLRWKRDAAATHQAYGRNDQQVFATFFEQMTDPDVKGVTSVWVAYSFYEAWCSFQGIFPVKKARFKEELALMFGELVPDFFAKRDSWVKGFTVRESSRHELYELTGFAI